MAELAEQGSSSPNLGVLGSNPLHDFFGRAHAHGFPNVFTSRVWYYTGAGFTLCALEG